jgi:hypothetical protein
MHFCQDEAAALLGVLGSIRLAWAWLKNKYRAIRASRNTRRTLHIMSVQRKRQPTDMERVAAMMKGEKS